MVVNNVHSKNETPTIEFSYEQLNDIKAALDESVILAVTNHLGVITFVNDWFCEISKYTREELIGQNHRVLNSGFHSKVFFKEMWKTIGSGEIWHGDICNRAKDGSLYWVQTTIVPFLNEKGKPYQYIAIRVDVTAKKNMDLITYIANHDDLTSLPNRRSLSIRLNKEIKDSKLNNSKFALFFIDINRFRRINDSLGHHVGDLFLVEVANRFKEIDSTRDSFYRISGDEFVYFLDHIDNLHMMAQRIISVFKKPFQFEGKEFLSSICIGISIFPEHGEEIENLLVSADMALHVAKNKRGNYYQLYKENIQRMDNQTLEMETKLYKAIHQNLLELHYQPKMDIKSNKMIGMEALLRWYDSELGQIPPNKFIPIAEESGLICDIGEWVLRKASLQIMQWKEQYGLNLRVAVNISPTHFEEPCFIDRLKIIIEETNVNPKNLEIEITELSMMHYNDELIKKIQKLKDLGLTISIDDFGTGYSSLSYLKNFPVDTLKIDRSFIVNMIEGDSNIAMVSAIISLAHALKMSVVAEGVENEYELDILKKHHCEFVQGYYFSKPLSVSDFNRFIENTI